MESFRSDRGEYQDPVVPLGDLVRRWGNLNVHRHWVSTEGFEGRDPRELSELMVIYRFLNPMENVVVGLYGLDFVNDVESGLAGSVTVGEEINRD